MQLSLTLGTTDLEMTYDFYRQIPGLSVSWLSRSTDAGTSLMLCANNFKIVFLPLNTLEQQHPVLFQHLSRTSLGAGMTLEFECPELDPIYLAARRNNWPILYELDDREHLRRELWLQDPNGYLIAMNEEPPPVP